MANFLYLCGPAFVNGDVVNAQNGGKAREKSKRAILRQRRVSSLLPDVNISGAEQGPGGAEDPTHTKICGSGGTAPYVLLPTKIASDRGIGDIYQSAHFLPSDDSRTT
ncbi:unnamed protein product [Porites lobata]|uniref:Uncharacterized protein n=1 Tax=Porites lobata TaxID=104759 RepID=A0ABN8RBB9_9CNID|nr:unnamed protein product [Porites lobata]